MINDPFFYPLAILAILIIGMSKSGFGGGLGVLAVPIMSLAISPQQAAAILLPLLCLMDIFAVIQYRRSFDKRNLFILLPAAMVGIVLGTLFFRYLSEAHIRVMVGVISVLFVVHFFAKTSPEPHRADVGRGLFWGTVAGFTSFGVHAGGPPVNMYLLPQRLHKSLFVGTTVIFFMIVNYVKLIPYAFLGNLSGGNLLTSLVFAPLAPLGIWLGVKLHHRINEKIFYTLCYIFLGITGVKLIWDGVMSW